MARPLIAQLMVVAKTITIAAMAAMAVLVVAVYYSVGRVVVKVAVKIAVAIAELAEVNCRNLLPSHRPIHLMIQVVIRSKVAVKMVLLARAGTLRHC